MYVFLYLPVHNLYIISNGITLYIIYATILVNGKRRPDQKSFLNFFLFLFEWKSLFKLCTEMLMFDHFDMVCFVLFLECGFFCWFLFWTCSDAWSTKQLTLIQMSKLGTSSAVSLSYSQSQRMQTSEGWVIGPTRWKECVLCCALSLCHRSDPEKIIFSWVVSSVSHVAPCSPGQASLRTVVCMREKLCRQMTRETIQMRSKTVPWNSQDRVKVYFLFWACTAEFSARSVCFWMCVFCFFANE